jgi:hypothetical protein
MTRASLPGLRRRDLLGATAALVGTGGLAHAADVPAAEIRFPTPSEALDALCRGPAAAYYAGMGLLEIRARVPGLPADTALDAARTAVAAFDGASIQPFSETEMAALRGIAGRLQPRLAARAPLYARTPWSFIKLADAAEGGMPHTRGRHVVVPAAVAATLAERHRAAAKAGMLEAARFGESLLVHEQTHVLQRADPARFEPLFTEALGFVRMTARPRDAWLDAHLVSNPDAPDLGWAFPLERVGGRGWIVPTTLLPDVPHPRMPRDFEVVAVHVARDPAGAWQLLREADGRPRTTPLEQVPGYDALLPFAEEDIHPNEIAAVALSHWILQDVPDLAARPRIDRVAAWARDALA